MFLLILRNFYKHLFYRTRLDDCFCQSLKHIQKLIFLGQTTAFHIIVYFERKDLLKNCWIKTQVEIDFTVKCFIQFLNRLYCILSIMLTFSREKTVFFERFKVIFILIYYIIFTMIWTSISLQKQSSKVALKKSCS